MFEKVWLQYLKVKRYFLLILLATLLGGGGAFILENNKERSYLSTIVIKTNYSNLKAVSDSLNSMLAKSKIQYLDETPIGDSAKEALSSLIKVYSINSLQEVGKVDLRKLNYPRGFIDEVSEGQIALIVLYLKEKVDKGFIHSAVLDFYRRVPFNSEVLERRRKAIKSRIAFFEDELNRLESYSGSRIDSLNLEGFSDILNTRINFKLSLLDQRNQLKQVNKVELQSSTPVLVNPPDLLRSSIIGLIMGLLLSVIGVLLFGKTKS
ncbi:MAG: hypothetical protein RIC95_00700 [Vicingaceae bacterium]